MDKQVIVIIHAEIYRGERADPIRIARSFPETATLKEVLAKRESPYKEWIEIPVQGDVEEATPDA